MVLFDKQIGLRKSPGDSAGRTRRSLGSRCRYCHSYRRNMIKKKSSKPRLFCYKHAGSRNTLKLYIYIICLFLLHQNNNKKVAMAPLPRHVGRLGCHYGLWGPSLLHQLLWWHSAWENPKFFWLKTWSYKLLSPFFPSHFVWNCMYWQHASCFWVVELLSIQGLPLKMAQQSGSQLPKAVNSIDATVAKPCAERGSRILSNTATQQRRPHPNRSGLDLWLENWNLHFMCFISCVWGVKLQKAI